MKILINMLTQEKEKKYREIVLQGAKEIYKANLVDFGEGNVSMRVKKRDEMFITPTQNDYATLKLEDIVHIQFDGTQLSEGRPASSEYRLHSAIYKERPKAKCVIHTHSVYACILGAVQQKIPVLLEEMIFFLGGEIEVAEFTPAGTDDIGEIALKAMGDKNAVLLTNHGVVVCGKDMTSAVKNAKLVEKLSQIYWGAAHLGKIQTIEEKYWKKWLELYKAVNNTAKFKRH
ncbi:MAG: class II aldolase/adducin family protein [Promethearchaeia archaeon]|nr:MAG: class II aldolase/adducin family protein [Candidatus Lokiarchaeia archaeon]